jgi:MYXO-CTERM domain-containing protein
MSQKARCRRPSLGHLVFFGLLFADSPTVFANGAFPDEFSIHFPAGSPDTILLGANFGLLVSTDNGATWRYSCEPYVTTGSSAALSSYNVGYYQVTLDGDILADSVVLTRSADMGCTWPNATVPNVPPNYLSDIFASQGDASLVFGIVTALSSSSIVLSLDAGETFDEGVYTTSALLTGVEGSLSQPSVAYATSISASGDVATLLRSEDTGQTWTPFDIALAQYAQPSIVAIDPVDENTVYLRVTTGLTDSIVVTHDGGMTFQNILTINDNFRAFLRAGDGTLYAATINGALYVLPPGAQQFETRTGPHFRCLGQRPGTSRIYACGNYLLDGFSIGYSDDGAQTFQKLMSFTDLLGPLTCPQVQTACAAHWARIQGVLGITDGGSDAGQTPDAGQMPDAGHTPDAGPSDAGPTDAGPAGGGGHSGCSAGDGDYSAVYGLFFVLAIMLLARRRKADCPGALRPSRDDGL